MLRGGLIITFVLVTLVYWVTTQYTLCLDHTNSALLAHVDLMPTITTGSFQQGCYSVISQPALVQGVILSQLWSFAFFHLNSWSFVGAVPESLEVPLNKSPVIPCNVVPLVHCHLQTYRGYLFFFVSVWVTDGVEQDGPSWYSIASWTLNISPHSCVLYSVERIMC